MMTDRAALGWRVYGLTIIALAVTCLVWGMLDPGQPLPKNFPAQAALAMVLPIFMLLMGVGIEWRKTVAWAAGALALFYGIVVVVLMNGLIILHNLAVYGSYSGTAEQLAIGIGAFIIWASFAAIDATQASRLIRIGQIAFGVCAVLFGGAHFAYMNLTAPLVPKWLPPGQEFWGYATGVFHIAGGLAIIANVRARLAAILLAVMYALFTPLALLPQLLPDLHHPGWWFENMENLVLTAVAWVVADSLSRTGAVVRAPARLTVVSSS